MIHVGLRHLQREILAFPLERLVEQQTLCADTERAAKCD
jgi:hypothetical protein